MIDYLRGVVAESNPTYAVVECGGVGYEVNVTLIDYPEIKVGEVTRVYIYEAIREDAHILYGFLTTRARELFKLLIGVSGVGPNTARLILSAMAPAQLEETIASGNDSMLKSVKGIGGKTAQRIIVDLKDKIKVTGETFITSTPASESYDDSVAALVMLGFTPQQSQKVLKKIFAATPGISTEKAIKQALTML